MKPKIYFDINGVIEHGGFLAIGIKEFVKYLVENNYEIFWLTTHCTNGDSSSAIFYLRTITDDQEMLNMFTYIKPTGWKFIKPEALGESTDCIWYEDKELSDIETEYLNERGILGFYRRVDLNLDSDFFEKELVLFKRKQQ